MSSSKKAHKRAFLASTRSALRLPGRRRLRSARPRVARSDSSNRTAPKGGRSREHSVALPEGY
eukprot:15104598-Alexandrium_andersonii.AAC.1